MEEVKVRFGRRLREVSLAQGISRKKLVVKADIARNLVAMIETGQRNFTLETVEKLAPALTCRDGIADIRFGKVIEVRFLESPPQPWSS